jgi:hypothetical protein
VIHQGVEIFAGASVLPVEKVRQVTMDMIVDTCEFLVSLPHSLVDWLGLPFLREDEVILADLNAEKSCRTHPKLRG